MHIVFRGAVDLETASVAFVECRFQERLDAYGNGIPEEARRVIDEELAKLGTLEPVCE